LAQLKKRQIWNDIKAEWNRQDDVTTELATKHAKTYKWMQRKVLRLPEYGNGQRKVNAWNAYLHVQSLEINEGAVIPND
jgi:hypothetical protein